jgi:hydrogenase-4 transcriptional activator
MRSADLFGRYVRGLASLLGVKGVTVYVPGLPLGSGSTLRHDGEFPPIRELMDAPSAEQFARDVAPVLRGLRDLAPEITAVEVPSGTPDGRLIAILSQPSARLPERRQAGLSAPPDRENPLLSAAGVDLWLGLRIPDEAAAAMRLPPRPSGPRAVDAEWGWLLGFAGELGRHASRVSQILDDPVTGLPGRAEFQVDLERALEQALQRDAPLALLMVNPDDFNAVNERMSRESADEVVKEIALRLQASHRGSDRVCRYGGVVFASILGETGRTEGLRRGAQILEEMHARPFTTGVSLRFSLGLACRESGEKGVRRALDLIRRADAALSAAKLAGGGRIVGWEAAHEEEGQLDRLTGIFTGQMARDYRNMSVLSDTITVLAVSAEPHMLAERVVKGLQAALKPDRVGIFEWPAPGVHAEPGRSEDVPQLVYGAVRGGLSGTGPEALPLSALEQRLLETARRRARPLEQLEDHGPESTLAFAVPLLLAHDEVLGVLYLAGRAGSMSLDSSDLVFLDALATQVALALDRARLTERQRQHDAQERVRLQGEVEELRSVLRRTRILYRSPRMEELLVRTRRVAPTDATVLITGESGTGKEVLARTIHELSPRREHPFVVVDCGAIPNTLVESELFGHEKGAFTGAQHKQAGRLVQAEKGTLLLDEIGELPIEAQSRLLRFVQDKQVTPVGGHAGRTVDVRLLAATNRDLQTEVTAGRFRADLYHRLNVVRMEIPPLRERPEDVPHLAQHFGRTYALVHNRPAFAFSPEAESALLQHTWPGNVRELQNRVMRAVIMSTGPDLEASDLGLPAEDAALATEALPGEPKQTSRRPMTSGDAWQELRNSLRQQVERALAGPRPLPPLGRWLADDVVLEASARGGGVIARGAALLGIPTSTFRRRLEGSSSGAGWSAPRPQGWTEVRAALGQVLRGPESRGEDRLQRVQQVLMEEVLSRVPDTPRTAAALLGVSLPTFRRRSEALASSPEAPSAEPAS